MKSRLLLLLATTLVAFMLAWFTLVFVTLYGVAYAMTSFEAWREGSATFTFGGQVIAPVWIVGLCVYLVVGLRRAYGLRWRGSVPFGLIVGTVGLGLAIDLYQRALFYVAFYTLDVPTP